MVSTETLVLYRTKLNCPSCVTLPLSVQISSRNIAEILHFKFKHGDPFHCQAELNFKALRVCEKHKGSGEFFSFNAVVCATFFLKKFVSCLPQTGFIGLVLQSFQMKKKHSWHLLQILRHLYTFLPAILRTMQRFSK